MPGIRVMHPTQRNVRYTVVDGTRPYPNPITCTPPTVGGCGTIHLFKTYHLNLDETGSVIVSTGVFKRIRDRLALDGFSITNEVAAPPPLELATTRNGTGPIIAVPIVQSDNHREPI